MSDITLQEVRGGLYRIYWALINIKQEVGSIFSKSVQLSPANKITITYQFQTKNDGSLKQMKRMQYVYSLIVEVEETCCNGVETKEIEVSHPSHRPLYVWLKNRHANKEDVRLKKISSVKWILSRKTKKPKECFTIYLDCGTKTLSESKIIEGFAKMFDHQQLCDVHFHFNDGQSIGAHANVLSIGSPVFFAMFQSDMLESQTRQVVITDCDLEVFRQLLLHLYMGKAPRLAEEDMTQILYHLADKYGVESIKHECVDVLLKRVKLDNAISLLIWADFHSILKLRECAVQFLVLNCRQICIKPEWLDFIKNHPELCMLVTQHMSALVSMPTTVTK